MSTQQEIADLATRFFDAIEAGNVEEVRNIYAPDAVIWHNTDNAESTPAQNLEVLKGFIARIRDRRYENRRLEIFADGFVQQHRLTGRRADGMAVTLTACLVCKVSNGRITRLDEYFDSAAVVAWLA